MSWGRCSEIRSHNVDFQPDEIDLKGMENFVKAVRSSNPPYAKIGVLGANVTRDGGKPTNADIGAAHEYGSPERGLPVRSFLRVPLAEQLPKRLEDTDLLGEDEMRKVAETGSLTPWMKKIAVIAVGVVKEAFATQGYGKWPSWKTPGYTNNTGQVLMDTKQLERSITEEVVEP